MKFTWIFFFLVTINGYCQSDSKFNSGKVSYEVELLQISNLYEKYELNDSIDPIAKYQMMSLFKDNKSVISTLIFNSNESLYKVKSDPEHLEKFNFSYAKAGGNGFYYSNTKEKKQIHNMEDRMANEWLLISFDFPEWKITNETKKILGYICYKAIEIRPKDKSDMYKLHTAWFTKEIPVSIGPKNFGGLPGLVLEIDRDNFTIKAKRIKLDSVNIPITRPIIGAKITQKEYNERYKDFFNKN